MKDKMKVLFCSYEVAPFYKKGGLGDVAGSLPKALKKLGVDISVVMPEYKLKTNPPAGGEKLKITDKKFKIEFDGREEKVEIWESVLPGSEVPIYLLENEKYLSGLKEGKKCLEQFAFFSKAIMEFTRYTLQVTRYRFDLIHLNDWHTSLAPLLIKLQKIPNKPVTLLTIHNLSHQGVAPLNILPSLGISKESSRVLSWDAADGNVEVLIEGIIHSAIVNTVSPTYAKEILNPKFSGRTGEILKGKEGRIYGILNGIDYDVWNPEADKLINFQFSIFNFQKGKRENKIVLQKELGLAVDEKTPLLAFIGRLAGKQKGLDILYEALIKLLPKEKFQFVLLGTGSREWEEKFRKLTKKEKQVAAVIRFDESLAHRIYAGADFVLVPSKFEPCGLIQMIAMRYGTLPIVRKTGGLADTVKDGVNGFVFEEYSSKALVKCIEQVLCKFEIRNSKFEIMINRAMSEDFSWESSAKEYLKLYKKALEIKRES